VHCSQKLQKNPLKTFFGGGEFKVINVDQSKKPVISAFYDKQHVYTHLQPYSKQKSQ